jgi:iron(III) transport system substrate-binding protein
MTAMAGPVDLLRRVQAAAVVAILIFPVGCSDEVTVEDSQTTAQSDADRIVVYATIGADILAPVFDAYTAETGMTVQLVTGELPELARKIHKPGHDPVADLFIAGSSVALWRAVELDIFRPTRSDVIKERVAEQFRDPDHLWVSVATEARAVVYNTDLANDTDLTTVIDYASLGEERWRQRLCLSSSGVAGNGSLLAMLVNDNGIREAELIVRGWRANLARSVYGDDRRLLQAIGTGRCVIGIAGSSEIARYLRTNKDARIAPHWFATPGVLHIDASGAGVTRHAQNPRHAAALLEWLTSEAANALFAARTLHFPVNPRSAVAASIAAWPEFAANPAHVASFRFLHEDAIEIAERAQYPLVTTRFGESGSSIPGTAAPQSRQ